MRLPFDHGAPPPLQNGTVGWGESYGGELNALSAMFESRVAPGPSGH